MMASLLGLWLFTGIIYQNQESPRPNPDLIMTFHFQDGGRNVLHYHRKNETGFCERESRYSFDGDILYQEVIRVNPQNASYCSSDKDMQLGSISLTPIERVGDRLLMHLNLGDEAFTYIWSLCHDEITTGGREDLPISFPILCPFFRHAVR